MASAAIRRADRADFYADARAARICYATIRPYLKDGSGITEWDFMPERWSPRRKECEPPRVREDMSDEEVEIVITRMLKPMLDAAEMAGPSEGGRD